MLSDSGRSLPKSVLMACNSLGDGMVIVDEDRVIRYMNPAACHLLGTVATISYHSSRCHTVFRCGPPEAPNRFCGHCHVGRALLKGTGTVRFTAAMGVGDKRSWVDATCTWVPGRKKEAVLILRPHGPTAEQPEMEQEPGDAWLSPHSTTVLQGLVRSARELLAADYAALGRLDPFRLEVVWLVQDGHRSAATSGTRVPLGEGIRGRVVSTGEQVCINNFPDKALDAPEKHKTMSAEGLKAALAVPVVINGEPTGVLMVAARHPAEYGPAQSQVLRNLAALAGEVLEHADWIQTAQAASIREEREWLAAELHDGLAQLLGAITQRLKLARWVLGRSTDAANVAADLQEVLELSEEAHKELRMALGELRNPAVVGDFRKALEAALKLFSERSGLVAELVEVPEQRPPIPPTVTLQVLRIVQEALNNARKHSGGSHVWIRWTFADDRHTFAIKDDGKGFVPTGLGHGFGMTIMSDRAHRIGGDLKIYGAPESGCTVILTVPNRKGGLST
ncbi:MAG TPA: GAF domain-containing protein [Symbiobacteriaceae bacterium]|nr:GAF domain-containing protein [Symbiobacteriaceae bacterium]